VHKGIYLPFDQLHLNYGALKSATPTDSIIIMVESQRMLRARRWHRQRLWFLLSAARHFAQDLTDLGFQVEYVKAETTAAGLKAVIEKHHLIEVSAARPNSYRMREELSEILNYVENDFFLTKESDFIEWAKSQSSLVMENFYRLQRKRLNILMVDEKPMGGSWNFDKDNRDVPPKDYEFSGYLTHELDTLDQQVILELEEMNIDLWGELPNQTWGSTRSAALAQLEYFLQNHFHNFGPYEDAMLSRNWSLHHSLLSPYLNLGLIHASEVIAAVRARFLLGDISISSCEGFIRQLIGWREYINGMYWFLGQEYRSENQLGLHRKLLPLFDDPEKTKMQCVFTQIKDLQNRAWLHHIPRLMVLSNLALLAGVNPQEYLDWMRERFIDAADWVMVPNVIGMGMHSDGGKMMTKPYVSGGSYINKMSDYCKSCVYDPKRRTGDLACPFTNLYWNFLANNQEEFKRNPRMFQQLAGLRRLKDLEVVLLQSDEILAKLSKGEI
jgi:deoxyribodipyrimidine photolyase-related protein